MASVSLKPRVVMAGEPRRTPLVTKGFSGSFGIAFLFTVMCARPNAASASLLLIFFGRRSTSITCDSVRPDDAKPTRNQALGHRIGVLDHLLLVNLESLAPALFERHGLARDHVHQGPALNTGKMAELMTFSYSGFIKMMPPR